MAGKPKYEARPATPMNQWVRDALEHAGLNYPETARRMTTQLRKNYDRSIIQKMTVGRGVSADEAAALARITGFPLPASDDMEMRIARYKALPPRDRRAIDALIDELSSNPTTDEK